MPAIKLPIHSVIFDSASWMTIDIKDYYLNTPLLCPEYVRIPMRFIPTPTILTHNLQPYIFNNSILFEVSKGMYGLPQAGLLAQQRLVKHLSRHGYTETPTPCPFRHTSNGTVFALVVDDFGIKYTTPVGAAHLIHTLRFLYEIKTDHDGRKYIGFTISAPYEPLHSPCPDTLPKSFNDSTFPLRPRLLPRPSTVPPRTVNPAKTDH